MTGQAALPKHRPWSTLDRLAYLLEKGKSTLCGYDKLEYCGLIVSTIFDIARRARQKTFQTSLGTKDIAFALVLGKDSCSPFVDTHAAHRITHP